MEEINFGKGEFEGFNIHCSGEIILSEHKLFLKDGGNDLTQTYVPLEKIYRIKRNGDKVEFFIQLTVTNKSKGCFKGSRKRIKGLINELVLRRGFKKAFLRNEWSEVNH